MLALVLVLVGFGLRIGGVTGYWINPDEGTYLQASKTQESLWAEFSENAHPPLFYMLLNWVGMLSESYLALRGFVLLTGCAVIFGMYLLAAEVGGVLAGLLAAAVLTVSPSAIEHSQVIRPYMPQMVCLVFGLWCLAKFIRAGTQRNLWLCSLGLTLAVLIHYSSFLVVAGLGLSVGVLLTMGRLDRSLAKPLVLASVPILVTMVLLYTLHVRPRLEGSELQELAQTGWLASYMIAGGSEVWMHLVGVLRYLFGPGNEGLVVLLLLLGLVFAVRERRDLVLAWSLAILLVGIAAAWAQKYPFGMTRHSMYLTPFLVVPLVLPLAACLRKGRVWAGGTALVAGTLFFWSAPLNTAVGAASLTYRPDPERLVEVAAIEDIESGLSAARSAGIPMLMDRETYYSMLPLFDGAELAREDLSGDLFHFQWDGSRVLVRNTWDLRLEAEREIDSFDGFLDSIHRADPTLRIRELRVVAVPVIGWTPHLAVNFDQAPDRGQFAQKDRNPVLQASLWKVDIRSYTELRR